MAVFGADGQTSQTTAVQVNAQAPTYLYGGQASKLEGDIKKKGGDNFAWKGSGAVTWEVQIATPGEYAVGLCHAAEPGAAGPEFTRIIRSDVLKEMRQHLREEQP